MGLINEFKEFAMRGNVVDMAVGIVIGAAFGQIVSGTFIEVAQQIAAALDVVRKLGARLALEDKDGCFGAETEGTQPALFRVVVDYHNGVAHVRVSKVVSRALAHMHQPSRNAFGGCDRRDDAVGAHGQHGQFNIK